MTKQQGKVSPYAEMHWGISTSDAPRPRALSTSSCQYCWEELSLKPVSPLPAVCFWCASASARLWRHPLVGSRLIVHLNYSQPLSLAYFPHWHKPFSCLAPSSSSFFFSKGEKKKLFLAFCPATAAPSINVLPDCIPFIPTCFLWLEEHLDLTGLLNSTLRFLFFVVVVGFLVVSFFAKEGLFYCDVTAGSSAGAFIVWIFHFTRRCPALCIWDTLRKLATGTLVKPQLCAIQMVLRMTFCTASENLPYL